MKKSAKLHSHTSKAAMLVSRANAGISAEPVDILFNLRLVSSVIDIVVAKFLLKICILPSTKTWFPIL